jgi:hypothetical protein
MTITRLLSPVPRNLPAARLFLDDIEEIVRILVNSGQGHDAPASSKFDWPPLQIKFLTGNKLCDQIEELPQIAKSTKNLLVEVSRGSHFLAVLEIYRFADLAIHGLSYDERLAVFHRVEDIFKQRGLPWQVLTWESVRNAPRWTGVVIGVLSGFVCGTVGMLLSKGLHLARPWPARIAFAAVPVCTVASVWALTRGTTVILRKFSEQAEVQQEKMQKFLFEAIKLVVAFLLGVLTLFLKHKYWP